MKPRTILVTGAAGLVGAEVAAGLAAAGHAVIALVHSRGELTRNDGRPVRTVTTLPPPPGSIGILRGDVGQHLLGLPKDLYGTLRACISQTVHCAAITDFGRSRETYESINVAGTKNVLEFVRDAAAGWAGLVYVSTAYVCGERLGTIREDELDVGQKFGTEYEASKFRAEMMVREYSSHGMPPVAIVRPSIVVGAERTGVVREFKNIYVVLKMLTEGRVRSIPGHYDATLDLVPVDYVAAVIVQAALRPDESTGKTFHAVGAKPYTLRDFSDVLAEYPTFHVPRYVQPQGFSAEHLPAAERVYYERILSLYESFFCRRAVFATDAAVELVGRVPASHGKPYLRKILDYCLRAGYLGNPQPGVQEVLTSLSQRADM